MPKKYAPQKRWEKKKLIKSKKVCFHIENEKELLEYADGLKNFSAHLKNLLEKEMNKL